MEEEKNKLSKWKIIGIVAGIILTGVGLYMMSSKSGIVVDFKTEEGSTHSIKELMALNRPLQCSFSLKNGVSSVSGGILISGKNVRGDFDIEGSPVGSIASHFIVKDGISYTWTSIANIGFKKVVANTANTDASPQDQASIVGVNDKIAYTCKDWNENATMFNIPSGITFSELK